MVVCVRRNSKWLWWIDKHQLWDVWIDFSKVLLNIVCLGFVQCQKSFLCGRLWKQASCGILSRNLTRVYVRLTILFVNYFLIDHLVRTTFAVSLWVVWHPLAGHGCSSNCSKVYWHELSIKSLFNLKTRSIKLIHHFHPKQIFSILKLSMCRLSICVIVVIALRS